MIPIRALGWLAAIGVTSVLALACVDLFHGTDWKTLCDLDATACAGDAGADAVPPVEDLSLCRESPRALAQNICVRLAACVGPLGSTSFGECSVEAQLAYDCAANPDLRPLGDRARLWRCLEGARTCDAMRRCVFPDNGSQPCNVSGGTFVGCGTANPNTRVACTDGVATSVGVDTCLASGRTCSPALRNQEGVCAGRESLRCATSTTRTCAGTSAVDCQRPEGAERPVDLGVDCATLGAGACVNTPAGPACAPIAREGALGCSDAPPRCDGPVVRACVNDVQVAVDCGRLGLDCVEPDQGPRPFDLASYCRATTKECTDAVDTCAGAFVTSCRRGQLVDVDCISSGYGACQVAKASAGACLSL